VNLLLVDNVLEFLDDRVRRSKYPDLTDIPKLVGLLQKYVQHYDSVCDKIDLCSA
jgi:hypothetical protein